MQTHTMKIGRKILLIVAWLLALTVPALPQAGYEVPVVRISEEKITSPDGTEFFLHEVKPRETITAICKAYGVTQKDLVAANPSLIVGNIGIGSQLRIPAGNFAAQTLEDAWYTYHVAKKGETVSSISRRYNTTVALLEEHNRELKMAPLRENQVVKIPRKGADFSQLSSQIASARESAKNAPAFQTHIVQRRETAFQISKLYDISISDLAAMNPDLNPKRPTVKVGQELKIRELKSEKEYISHIVQRRETLPAIAEKYKVTVNQILEANPSIDPNALLLSQGQTLRIPIDKNLNNLELPVDRSKVDTVFLEELDLTQRSRSRAADVIARALGSAAEGESISSPSQPLTQEFRIALLLPLQLQQSADPFLPLKSINPEAMAALEFYEGAVLAFDSLRQAGLRAELFLFDTGYSTSTLRQTLNLDQMQRMDLIIGPFFSDMLPTVSDFSRRHRIPLAVPTLTAISSELLSNPYLIAVNPDATNGVRAMLRHIVSQPDAQVILVTNPDETGSPEYTLYSALLQEMIPGRFRTVSGTAPQVAIAEGKQNLFVIPSTNEAFVIRTLASLNRAAFTNAVGVFAPPSWNQFKNIDLEYFHNVQYRFWSGFSIDYNNPVTQSFLRKYQTEFRSEPYRQVAGSFNYGFLGYDLSLFLGSGLLYHGNRLLESLPRHAAACTQSEFAFDRRGDGCFVNNRIYLVTFTRNFTIETISL